MFSCVALLDCLLELLLGDIRLITGMLVVLMRDVHGRRSCCTLGSGSIDRRLIGWVRFEFGIGISVRRYHMAVHRISIPRLTILAICVYAMFEALTMRG